MNRKAKSVLYSISLWLVIPVGLLALGFYVIGPRLGLTHIPGVTAPEPPSTTDAQPADSTPTDSTQASTEHFSPPDVKVSVEEGAQFNVHASTYHGHRKHRSRKRKKAGAAPGTGAPAAPSENGNAPAGGTDSGGSGGGGGVG